MVGTKVSIIVTTKNEEKNITNCLRSVRSQSYTQELIEIIVVDNNSSDKTKEIALKYTDNVFDKGPERSAQRNFGIRKSTGEYFLYLDADMIMDENLVRDCVNCIQKDSSIVALYISEIVMGDTFFSKIRRFERSFYDATVIDCVRFIQRESFDQVGGFDEGLTGPEDWDFDKKIRNCGKVDLIQTPIYHNEEEFNLSRYLKKKGYYAKNFDKYIEKWGKEDSDIVKQFGIWYRFCLVFIENGKWKKLVCHPILTFGMYFLRGLVGLKFLFRNR